MSKGWSGEVPQRALQQQQQQQNDGAPVPATVDDIQSVATVNLAVLYPPRWGWTVAGGIADVLPPHERARRKAFKKDFVKSKRKRDRDEAFTTSEERGSNASITTDSLKNGLSEGEAPTNAAKATIASGVSTRENKAIGNHADSQLECADEMLEMISGETDEIPRDNTAQEIGDNQMDRNGGEPPTKAAAPLRFQAVTDDGILDIYTYHRGRQGSELRDEATGDLLCDVEPTDTCYGVDEPKLIAASVVIQFPLEDAPAVVGGEQQSEIRYYQETISWNFADPYRPTPQEYAAGVANEYGLSFAQTLDLANSIQDQLQSFVKDNCSYAPPVVLKDSLGQIRDPKPRRAYDLYGEVTGAPTGGTPLISNTQKTKAPPKLSTSIPRVTVQERVKVAVGKQPMKSQAATDSATKLATCREEVRRRLRAACISDFKRKTEPGYHDCSDSARNEGRVEWQKDGICHACRRANGRCWRFPCELEGHEYCAQHLKSRMGISSPPSDEPSLPPSICDHCPVCSLSCACPKCLRRLHHVVSAFEASCLEQNAEPKDAVFDNILQFRRSLDKRGKLNNSLDVEPTATDGVLKGVNVRGRSRQKKGRLAGKVRPRVSKVPLVEFPREVCGGLDMNPGTPLEYETLYSSSGAVLASKNEGKNEQPSENPDEPSRDDDDNNLRCTEDAHVDFCQVCLKHGQLLCCDFCPRAFHMNCVQSRPESDKEGSAWECPICSREKGGVPEDEIDGSKSLDQVIAAYDNLVAVPVKDLDKLRLLSILHEMVLSLSEYDFGFMFRQPVNIKQVPHYPLVVKKPMDLGTIASNILNGRYCKPSDDNMSILDDVILAVLKDIELVWHNCFTFNREGSAVYRMAEVQRRRSLRIRHKSFDTLLTDRIKQELDAYIRSCAQGQFGGDDCKESAVRSLVAAPESSTAGATCAVSGRHKITVSGKHYNSRTIAVLDPDTGRIVKMYTSMQSACAAVDLFVRLGYESELGELEGDLNQRVRRMIKQSTKHPELVLFGYRWLFLDELRKGKVVFTKPQTDETQPFEMEPPQTLIELVDGERAYLFATIDESLSFPGLEGDLAAIRDQLRSLPPGGEYLELSGMKWRLLSKEHMGHEGRSSRPSIDFKNGRSLIHGKRNISFLPGVVAVKEDMVSGKELIGFRSLDVAYQDWLQTVAAESDISDEQKTIDHFQSLYLDGARNIGGIVWRTRDRLAGRGKGPIDIEVDDVDDSEGDDSISEYGERETESVAEDPNNEAPQLSQADETSLTGYDGADETRHDYTLSQSMLALSDRFNSERSETNIPVLERTPEDDSSEQGLRPPETNVTLASGHPILDNAQPGPCNLEARLHAAFFPNASEVEAKDSAKADMPSIADGSEGFVPPSVHVKVGGTLCANLTVTQIGQKKNGAKKPRVGDEKARVSGKQATSVQ